MDDKRYQALLQALAQFVKQSGAAVGQLDDFLAGYAGDEWEAAKIGPL